MFWIAQINKAQVGFGPCPGGETINVDIKHYQSEGVGLVVSLLEEQEANILGLTDEESVCKRYKLPYINFPIRDMSIPSFKKLIEFEETLYNKTCSTDKIYIHCRHGIGRSALVVASLLVRNGMKLTEALMIIETKRGLKVPETLSQRKLLYAYSDYTGKNLKKLTKPDA